MSLKELIKKRNKTTDAFEGELNKAEEIKKARTFIQNLEEQQDDDNFFKSS